MTWLRVRLSERLFSFGNDWPDAWHCVDRRRREILFLVKLAVARVLKFADKRRPAIADEMTGTIACGGLKRLGPHGG